MSRWHAMQLPLKRRALPRHGHLELWLTDLAELPLDAGPTGLTRRERVLKQRIQQRFILRLLLGSYLGIPGKDLKIAQAEGGKPGLAGEQAMSGLKFNMSHSGSWLAIVIARGLEVGVDLECQRTLRRPVDLARRYFTASEADYLGELAEPQCSHEFLGLWTAREALVKAQGCGLAGALGHIELNYQPPSIKTLPEGWPEDWQLIAPEWPGDLIGHVAAPATQAELDCFFLKTG